MARLFYHRPRYAILDECTSGVTVDMEERFCDRVKALGCTCITISHRPALVPPLTPSKSLQYLHRGSKR